MTTTYTPTLNLAKDDFDVVTWHDDVNDNWDKIDAGFTSLEDAVAGGSVLGPTSSVDGNVAVFDGTTGNHIKDSGIAASTLVQGSGTDNHVVRWDGTNDAQDSTVVVDDTGEIYGYRVKLNQQTGTTYTLQTSDSGKIVELNNASAITLTCPRTMPVGAGGTLVQTGAGQVTLALESGAPASIVYQSKTKIAGQGAGITWYVGENSDGNSAVYRFLGTMA